MSLAPGTRIGAYEISRLIGAGGMGEVYRARDGRLQRDVAIKILPTAFAADPDRLARFEREAQVLASLNHPNIAAIYGFVDAGAAAFFAEPHPAHIGHVGPVPHGDTSQAPGGPAIHALVLELVDGPTLADRIAQGPIPLDDALSIARQIAEALEAAHEHGIVHRDLKPANVKVRPDGTVKVLDFGLAKLTDSSPVASDATVSPTITSPAVMTGAGMLLGTAAYMAPEQAKGRPADRRSDVWAFGVVLYEMLAGERVFRGDDVSDTLAFVIAREPDWKRLPPETPPPIRKLLRRCLEKDRRRRLADIADARLEIEEALAGPTTQADTAPPRPSARGAAWKRAAPWTLAGAMAASLAVVLAVWGPWRTIAATPVRLTAELGVDASVDNDPGAAATLSPDGSLLAFVAQSAGSRPRIHVRRLDQLQATPLAGTEDSASPFFSPDGQWIAFFADGKLKKVAVTGGAAVTLADAPNARGGAWAEDGSIVFTPSTAPGTVLMRVSSAGGQPMPLTTLGDGEVTQRWPQMLPGGKAVLFTGHSGTIAFDDASIVAQPLPSGARKIVQRGGYYGRYLPSGHLVYIYEGRLFAAPFDLDRLEMTAPPAPVLEGVDAITRSGGANFSAASNGTLVYLPGRGLGEELPLDWMDRTGAATPLRATPAGWESVQFAPDGRRLAMDISDGTQTDIWIYEWERDRTSRLTMDRNLDEWPTWTPDGERIAFASRRADKLTFNVYWQRADGTGEVQRLIESRNPQWPTSWHPNGRLLALSEQTPTNNEDILILPIDGDERSGWKPGKATVFVGGPSRERYAAFSPDGRWLAYASNESGRSEVYVRSYPDGNGPWQISTDDGILPTWSRTRSELFYSNSELQIMVVPYATTGEVFQPEKPRLMSERRFRRGRTGAGRSFDLHPDGNRLALAAVDETEAQTRRDKLVFIFNFFEELRRIAPGPAR